jgi:hypothetical protein
MLIKTVTLFHRVATPETLCVWSSGRPTNLPKLYAYVGELADLSNLTLNGFDEAIATLRPQPAALVTFASASGELRNH